MCEHAYIVEYYNLLSLKSVNKKAITYIVLNENFLYRVFA